MHDRGFQRARECDQLLMSSGATGSGKNRGFLRVVQNSCQLRDFVVGRTHRRLRFCKVQTRPSFDRISEPDVTGQGYDGNAAPRDRGLCGNLKHARHLLGLRNKFAVVAALREKMFWVGLLKISAPDFIAWNLRRNGENRNTAAMAVIEPINQMQVTGTAAAGADRQTPCEMRFRSSSKRRRLFMPYVNPLHSFACANRIRDPVERVAGNAVNSLNSCFRQYIHQQVCYVFLGHDDILSEGMKEELTFVRWRGFSLQPHTLIKFLSNSSESSSTAAKCSSPSNQPSSSASCVLPLKIGQSLSGEAESSLCFESFLDRMKVHSPLEIQDRRSWIKGPSLLVSALGHESPQLDAYLRSNCSGCADRCGSWLLLRSVSRSIQQTQQPTGRFARGVRDTVTAGC